MHIRNARRFLGGLMLGCAMPACLIPAGALAQGAPATEAAAENYGTIIITARKRAESIQNVPISVTAFDERALERNAITSIDQVSQFTPNVVFVPISISPTSVAPFIRGIGNYAQEPSQDPPIAISVDGVYLGQISGSLIDVFDASQIEVLRGPQGTLQGRNSPGGAINVTTRRPGDTFGARFDASYGNYNEIQVKGAVDLPFSEKIAAKAAFMVGDRDGFVENVTTGRKLSDQKSYAGRVGLLFEPTETLDVYITGDYSRDRSRQPGLRYMGHYADRPVLACTSLGLCAANPRFTSTANYDPRRQFFEGWGITANANLDLGGATITSVTGYRKGEDHQWVDVDSTEADIFGLEDRDLRTKQFSQEFRIASDAEGQAEAGQLDWVLGVFYMNSQFSMLQRQRIFGGDLGESYRDQTLKSYAVFGQATYNITDQLSVSAGARQSWDDKVLNSRPIGSPVTGEYDAKFDNLSLELGAEYRFTPDAMAYARFSQGYRSGGINGAASRLIDVNAYGPEKVDAYEVGIKTEWFDRRLLVNLTGFRSNYKDLQRNIIVTDANNNVLSNISNQGKARMQGIEAEVRLHVAEPLNVWGSYGYLHARYLDDAFRQFDVIYAPKHTASAGFDFTVPVRDQDRVVIGWDVSFKSRFNATPSTLQVGEQGAYAVVNATATYRFADDRFSIGAYARNLSNTYYITTASDNGGLANWVVEGAPRTYGVRMTAEF